MSLAPDQGALNYLKISLQEWGMCLLWYLFLKQFRPQSQGKVPWGRG